jgi:predicted nicotinamide N-methyase
MQEQQACSLGLSLDCITAADVVYQPENYSLLAATLRELAAPHTLVFVAFKQRGGLPCRCFVLPACCFCE